jgi:hypothetical protein
MPYASAGLVRREYGGHCVSALCAEHCAHRLTAQRAQEIAHGIDADVTLGAND